MRLRLLGAGNRNRGDCWLYIVAVGLAAFGIVMVYSASSYSAQIHFNDSFFFARKQIIGVILGLIAMILVRYVDYHKIVKLWWLGLAIAGLLLGLVLIPGVGVENYGAKRWIQLPGFTLQASEIAKFAYIIFAAHYMSKNYDRMNRFVTLLPLLLVGGGFCALIMLEPNMSITICMVGLMLTLMWLGGARLRHFVALLVPVLVAVPILIFAEPYRIDRLLAFLNPWANPQDEGFQLIQSYYGLGSGGWFGLGLFQSRQKYLFLPFAESDFIFSIVVEELGLVGGALLLLFYIALVVRCVKVAMRASDRMGSYLASGIAAIIAIQVLVNIAVVTGSIPPTGLPLPLLSSGSSSIVVTLAALGLVESVAAHSDPVRAYH